MLKLTSSIARNENKRCSWSLDIPGRKGDFQCGVIINFGRGAGVPLCPSHRSAFAESALSDGGGDFIDLTCKTFKSDGHGGGEFVSQGDEMRRKIKDLEYKISRMQGESNRASVSSEHTIKSLQSENGHLTQQVETLRAGLASSSRVYLIKCGDQVKIGRSGNPRKRLAQIRGGNACLMESTLDPLDAQLIYEMAGHAAEETELHRRFRAYRTTGEWFRIEGELANYIHSLNIATSIE